MSGGDFEAAKLIVPGLVGVAGGYLIKWLELSRQERKTESAAWLRQKQTHWLRLLKSARDLRHRLNYLTDVFQKKPGLPFTPESLSADFRELYLLSRNEVGNLQDCDPNQPRTVDALIQTMRSRVCHELTFAESSLYMTVAYLGNAELVLRDLNNDVLMLPDKARSNALELIGNVRQSLQGPTGAGMFSEQQEYMGEAVWNENGTIVSNLAFRNRLFDLPGWETFQNLLRFYAELGPKIDNEVAATIGALHKLEKSLERLCAAADMRVIEIGTTSPPRQPAAPEKVPPEKTPPRTSVA